MSLAIDRTIMSFKPEMFGDSCLEDMKERLMKYSLEKSAEISLLNVSDENKDKLTEFWIRHRAYQDARDFFMASPQLLWIEHEGRTDYGLLSVRIRTFESASASALAEYNKLSNKPESKLVASRIGGVRSVF